MESIEQQPVSTSPMRGQVLKKIYRVWFFRRFLPAVLIELAVFSAFLYFLARAVFVQKIVENALSVFSAHPAEIIGFILFAFLYAHIVVKILSFTILILVSYLIYKIFQGIIRFVLVKENYFGRSKQP